MIVIEIKIHALREQSLRIIPSHHIIKLIDSERGAKVRAYTINRATERDTKLHRETQTSIYVRSGCVNMLASGKRRRKKVRAEKEEKVTKQEKGGKRYTET